MRKETVTVLVVDDNATTLYSTSRVLKGAGYRVLEAATGTDAINLAKEEIDVAILDVNLPDINGFEVCKHIRLLDKSPRVPIIHLSASFVTDIDKVQGLDGGADGYLTHPVEPPVLIATVRAFLRIRDAEIEREQLLASERSARAEAERANRFKDEFLATLSHELRTPLQSMLGWAQLLKSGKPSDEDFAEGLEAIERNAQVQSKMIADLLDVARITSGQLRLDVQSVDLSAVIDAVTIAAAPAADAKEIRITKTLSAADGLVMGDPSRLQQVIWNLVNNAVKFTPKAGKIHLSLARVASYVQVEVADNGQGIDAELLPKIFERFRQGDATINRRTGGLGLGLAIARQLVELHGGRIRAESEGPGRGAKFVIQLPVTVARAPTKSKPIATVDMDIAIESLLSISRLDDIRVLLVDDDNDTRQVLCRILSSSGAIVKECNGVGAALDSIRDFKPQILVSDLGMPDQDGFALIRKVREFGYSFQDLPAIALTALARAQDRHKALRAGFQLHLAKPVEPQELTAAIASLMGRTSAVVD